MWFMNKIKVIALVIIEIIFFACTENDTAIEVLEIINEQNDIENRNVVLDENIETIYEQEDWMQTINEEDEFYKYKLIIEKFKNSNEQNNIVKNSVILEEEIETIAKRNYDDKSKVIVETITEQNKFDKYKLLIEKLKTSKKQNTVDPILENEFETITEQK